jgi:hypothetical protein
MRIQGGIEVDIEVRFDEWVLGQVKRWGAELTEAILRDVISASFGRGTLLGLPFDKVRHVVDGRLERCVATSSTTRLDVWLARSPNVMSSTWFVIAVAYGRRDALEELSESVQAQDQPILQAAAHVGGRRLMRHSFVRGYPAHRWEVADRPQRWEVVATGHLGWETAQYGGWLGRGAQVDVRARPRLFEVVGPGARRVGDPPAGLTLVPASPAAWTRVGDVLWIERPVVEVHRDRRELTIGLGLEGLVERLQDRLPTP